MKFRERTFPIAPNCFVSLMHLLYLCTLLAVFAILLYQVHVQNIVTVSYIVISKRNENRNFFKRQANVKSILVSLSL